MLNISLSSENIWCFNIQFIVNMVNTTHIGVNQTTIPDKISISINNTVLKQKQLNVVV